MGIGASTELPTFSEEKLRADPEFQRILARVRDNSDKNEHLAQLTREISQVEAETRHLIDETAALHIHNLEADRTKLQERLAKLGEDFSALSERCNECAQAEADLTAKQSASDVVWKQFGALLNSVIEEIKQANEIRHTLSLPPFRVPTEDQLAELMTSKNLDSLEKLLKQIETFYASATQS